MEKRMSNESLVIPMEELQVDDKHLTLVEFSPTTTLIILASRLHPLKHFMVASVDHLFARPRFQAARDRQKSYADVRRKPLEFQVGDKVMLKSLVIPLDGIQIDDKLHFVEEPMNVMDREVKQLKQSRIPIIKVRWNSRRGPEFPWEHTMERVDSGPDAQALTTTAIFWTDDPDAFDSDCDEAPSASAVLMSKLSAYDSDVLYEVPNYNTYQDNNVIDQSVQEI
ncbi:hypothetical protein Tco_1523769 [Tanacetum coccineum]